MNIAPLRSTDIRERNEKLVLNMIHKAKQISQSEVALMTGLKPPTVFRIFTILEKGGYILPLSPNQAGMPVVPGKKGRKPVAFQVNPDVHYILGIDWTRTPTLVIVDFSGQIIFSTTQEFPPDIDAEGSLGVIADMIEASLRDNSLPREKILGIGIGLPGRVDIEEGSIINYPRIPGMINFPIREKLAKKFDLPVYVHNNTSVIALSEYRYGKAQQLNSFLTILIRSGVGGAFVQNGVAFVNGHRTSVEIGHLGLDPRGPLCYCGQKGCLETYLSEDAFLFDLQKTLNLKSVLDLEPFLQQHDSRVLEVTRKKGEVLCRAIQSLVNIFSPEAILLITRSQLFSEHLVAVLGELECTHFSHPATLIASHYKPTLAAKAATDLIFDDFFQS
ncbi:MAG TPA: ROK family transcriptional regulator [Spirochaetales bacterium]|nr:ROK family transcriptional regulator [Spirochaetales bacterium]